MPGRRLSAGTASRGESRQARMPSLRRWGRRPIARSRRSGSSCVSRALSSATARCSASSTGMRSRAKKDGPCHGAGAPRYYEAPAGLVRRPIGPMARQEIHRRRSGRRPLRPLYGCTRRRPVHDRLVAAGKPKMVAAIAVARKLLTILNAIIRDNQPWQPA